MAEFETSSDTDSCPNLSENDDFEASSPKRRRVVEKSRFSGAFMYQAKFSKEWTKTWPFISAVPGDPFIARCNVCAKTVFPTRELLTCVVTFDQSRILS